MEVIYTNILHTCTHRHIQEYPQTHTHTNCTHRYIQRPKGHTHTKALTEHTDIQRAKRPHIHLPSTDCYTDIQGTDNHTDIQEIKTYRLTYKTDTYTDIQEIKTYRLTYKTDTTHTKGYKSTHRHIHI